MVVLKVNGEIILCLDLAKFNKALIRPVHRGPTLIDILPRVVGTNTKYLTLINAGSYYHNLKQDKRSLYLTMISCPFGRYGYMRLPFREVPTGDTFQKKIDELFSSMLMTL